MRSLALGMLGGASLMSSAFAEPCVGPGFEKPFPGATGVETLQVDVPSALFPGLWQQGLIDGFAFKIFANGSATLQDVQSPPAWSIVADCQQSACIREVSGSPPQVAWDAFKPLERCIAPPVVKVPKPTKTLSTKSATQKLAAKEKAQAKVVDAKPDPVKPTPKEPAPTKPAVKEPALSTKLAETKPTKEKVDPANTVPANSDTIKFGPEKPAPTKADPKNVAPIKLDPSRADPVKSDSTKTTSNKPVQSKPAHTKGGHLEIETTSTARSALASVVPAGTAGTIAMLGKSAPADAKSVAEQRGQCIDQEALEAALASCKLPNIVDENPVITLQQLLATAGADPGLIDGVYGARTKLALQQVLGFAGGGLEVNQAITAVETYLCLSRSL